jgi:4-hydroxy-tetrahydrodipicolinate reductase
MNLALIGYGKMGREIERLASSRGHAVVATIDVDSPPPTTETLRSTDVAIHFATVATLVDDLRPWAASGAHLVVGTTGWNDQMEAVRTLVTNHKVGLVHSANFSFGVWLFVRLVREAARGAANFPEYDIAVHEIHHTGKVDSPSGTALAIGAAILGEVPRKKELLLRVPDGPIRPEQLLISSARLGNVVGTHTVTLDSPADDIEITHSAKSRAGFALGALRAAEWIRGRQGFFGMDELFEGLRDQGAIEL